MLVTPEETTEIVAVLDEINKTGIITSEMTTYVDSNWIEFITVALTQENSAYRSVLNMFVQAEGGILNIERHTYIDLVEKLKGTQDERYLDSVVNYTREYAG